MIVCDLYIYPIKSCRGIRLEEAPVTPKGFVWDREFMLVDAGGKFLSQRQHPNLARIQVQIEGSSLCLTTDGLEKLSWQPTFQGKEIAVEIWRDRTVAIDQGDEIAQWFQTALALPPNFSCRLVRQSPNYLRPIDPNYAEKKGQPVSFADGYPFLLTATASLAELQRRLEETYADSTPTLPMNRFRPNIVVKTCEPFLEGSWQTLQIREWTMDLPPLTTAEQQRLDLIKQRYLYHRQFGHLLEGAVNFIVIAPLLELAGFYDPPFRLRSEASIRIKLEDENHHRPPPNRAVPPFPPT